MSEVRLVIRERQRDLSGTIHGSVADAVIAALSDDPETIEELDAALERFQASNGRSQFSWFSRGINDEPYDAGLVVVDLAARLIVCDSTYSAASRDGSVDYHDGHCATDIRVRYRLTDDWKIMSSRFGWRSESEERRGERAEPLDARAVLFGEPLLEFIARECFEAFAGVPVPPDDDSEATQAACDAERGTIREIHARWLMTPRDDLRGQAPRDVLLALREHIDWNLQHRCEQWSSMDKCPPGLSPDSAAHRLGGFGTHEIVTYYELVRSLVWSCRDAAAEVPRTGPAAVFSAGEFVPNEVRRLAAEREALLDAPDPEFDGRTPRSIIHKERARIPEGMTGAEAMIDCDCPLCQMQAELPGPVFWHMDGCNMDEDFAFSFHRTHEEWEKEQREYEEFSRRCDEREQERERSEAGSDSVWQRSFVADECYPSPVLQLFAIGSHLAELVDDLKSSRDGGELIGGLNRSFGNLREVAGACDPDASEDLIVPVVDRFCEMLDGVAAAHRDLEPKCADLRRTVTRFAESATAFDNPFDDDVPF